MVISVICSLEISRFCFRLKCRDYFIFLKLFTIIGFYLFLRNLARIPVTTVRRSCSVRDSQQPTNITIILYDLVCCHGRDYLCFGNCCAKEGGKLNRMFSLFAFCLLDGGPLNLF